MNPKAYLTNKHFCPIPWTGLMYNFDGNVKNCIRSSEPIGNIQNKPIEDILYGVQNSATKLDMIINAPGKRCHSCYDLEKETNSFEIISDRVFYLRELKSEPLELYADPTKFNLLTADVRWSNLCNFACVYCGPEFSSRWESEAGIQIKTPDQDNVAKFTDYIYKNAKQLKHIYLAGGEPLLMKENLQLLEFLLQENKEINIRVNTNLSKVDTRIFEKICSFKNVHWIVSVEAIEEEYEYIRYGGNWLDFLDNLEIIKNLDHKISFNMLHFALNSMSIFKCIDYLSKLGFHPNSFITGSLTGPLALNIRQLPDEMLLLVRNELITRINQRPGFLLENGLINLSKYLEQPFSRDTKQLFEYLNRLDNKRNLDSRKIFKDIYNYGNQTF
jgi:sulfatase maturation enzyme AslB (radical SAM superfamily)